ncbi:hypothetical protein PTI45_04730 [Paenibacillus nuruki]|uniref:Uncharacterized protein n=1 Tax=Paenibacillus nuruki TaxID=1886670 RepID=A0A1E3KYD9_9BACL|nr:hypothetical protein [Paenibacillus nuruki]ODP25935.1 hypothetical protein PTI45_04730 [Paenibacillus nuruki]
MLEKVLGFLKSSVNRTLLILILKRLSITSAFCACITLSGLVFYSIGYSFLFGYYFSGMSTSQISLISLLISNVPFPFYAVTITSTMFISVIAFFVILLWNISIGVKHVFTKGSRTLGFIRIFIVLFLFFLFHYSLSSFFVGGIFDPSQKSNSFFYVWLGPLAVAIGIFLFRQIQKGIISSFFGMLYGLLLITIFSILFNIPPSKNGLYELIIIFLVALLFSYFERALSHPIYRFALGIPASFIIMLFVTSIITIRSDNRIINWIIFSLCIMLISITISWLTRNWFKPKVNTDPLNEEEIEQLKVLNREALKRLGIITISSLFLLVTLAFVSTTIPDVAKLTGAFFRATTPKTEHQDIYYEDVAKSDDKSSHINTPQLKNVELVAQKDDMYYISDSNAKMIMIKTDKIRIESSKSDK